jgi:REP element-mobilizing transposase RayT
MQHFFGDVENDEMQLNGYGKLVHNEWEKTPLLRPDMNITLGEFRVMPNHFHGIIAIGANEFNKEHKSNKFGPQSKNLGATIGGFKSTLTIQIRKTMSWFAWHERYHDHIIRDDEEYQRIRQYIIDNPANWKKDKFYR